MAAVEFEQDRLPFCAIEKTRFIVLFRPTYVFVSPHNEAALGFVESHVVACGKCI